MPMLRLRVDCVSESSNDFHGPEPTNLPAMKTRAEKKVSLSALSLQVEQADRKVTEAKEGVRRAKARLRSSRKALKLARKEAKHARRSAKEAHKAWERASAKALSSSSDQQAAKKGGRKPPSAKKKSSKAKVTKPAGSARHRGVAGAGRRAAASPPRPRVPRRFQRFLRLWVRA